MDIQELENNMALFREMIRCGSEISTWCFDESGNLLETNSSHRDVFLELMKYFSFQTVLKQHSAQQSYPIWLTMPLGISWIAAFYKPEQQLRRIYMIGPVASVEISLRTIRDTLLSLPGLASSISWQQELEDAMHSVPVYSSMVMNQLCLMLHYAITAERIQTSDIAFQHNQIASTTGKAAPQDRHHTWMAEQNLMRMIREGDLNYKDALNRVRTLSSGVPLRTGDALRQAKTSVIVSISLCVRAAIQGGLSPETAYSVGDQYIQSVEEAKTLGDVGAIHHVMFADLVQRVHRCRSNPDVSQNIRRCCDYIETHTEDPLSIAQLAGMVGYTDYYLSRKFKEEVKVSISDYIKIARVERAKFLLSDGGCTVQEVAARLHFCSPSHFGSVFRKVTGCTPREFRESCETKLL